MFHLYMAKSQNMYILLQHVLSDIYVLLSDTINILFTCILKHYGYYHMCVYKDSFLINQHFNNSFASFLGCSQHNILKLSAWEGANLSVTSLKKAFLMCEYLEQLKIKCISSSISYLYIIYIFYYLVVC